jgi:glycosyltransferase involved in cell wall biosynthesis
MKKKLTIIINALQGGGAERVAVTVANYLVNNGYEINFTVMNLLNSVYQDQLDRKINLINLNVKHARSSLLAFRNYLGKYHPERILVFNHELAVVLVMLRMVMRCNFYLIARNINTLSENKKFEQSIWHKYFKDIIVRILYNGVDVIIAQSAGMKDDLINYYKISEQKITVINNPLPSEFNMVLKDTPAGPAQNKELLFVGRIEKQKGLKYLLDAMSLVIKKDPKVTLRILGEGSLKNKLINYAASIGISDHVIFDTFKMEIIPYYQNTSLTVLPSLFEGFPNVLVESIACGTPVIAFDCKSGPTEIIQDGVNGFLVEYLNTEKLAKKIIDGINHKWNKKEIQNTAISFTTEHILSKYMHVISE